MRDLGEGFEEIDLLRRQKELPAGGFAQAAQLFVVASLDQPRPDAFEVFCANAEDGHVVTLRHLEGVAERVLAGGVFAVRQHDDDAPRVAGEVRQLLFDDAVDGVVDARVAAGLDLANRLDQQLLVVCEVLVQLDVGIKGRERNLILAAIGGDGGDEIFGGVFLERQLELDAVAGVHQHGDVERQLARRDESLDLLPLAVFVDLEVFLGQAGDESAFRLDGDRQANFIHAHLGRLIVLRWLLLRRLVGRLLRERQGARQQGNNDRTDNDCG